MRNSYLLSKIPIFLACLRSLLTNSSRILMYSDRHRGVPQLNLNYRPPSRLALRHTWCYAHPQSLLVFKWYCRSCERDYAVTRPSSTVSHSSVVYLPFSIKESLSSCRYSCEGECRINVVLANATL